MEPESVHIDDLGFFSFIFKTGIWLIAIVMIIVAIIAALLFMMADRFDSHPRFYDSSLVTQKHSTLGKPSPDFMDGNWTDGNEVFRFRRRWLNRQNRYVNGGFDKGPDSFYDYFRPRDHTGRLIGGSPPGYVYYTHNYGARALPVITDSTGTQFRMNVNSRCCSGKKMDHDSILWEDGRIFRKVGRNRKAVDLSKM